MITPELCVTDCAASLAFWCGPCGFRVAYDRPEEGFALIERDGSRIMLDELPKDRPQRWEVAPIERPFGRHVNFEIAVASLDDVLTALDAAGWPLFMAPETKTYRVGEGSVTVRQFLVQDPDGYLLRFSEELVRNGVPARPDLAAMPSPSPRSGGTGAPT